MSEICLTWTRITGRFGPPSLRGHVGKWKAFSIFPSLRKPRGATTGFCLSTSLPGIIEEGMIDGETEEILMERAQQIFDEWIEGLYGRKE